MNIKKGDKVRFLNSVGGGTVSRVIKDQAFVEDNDGFEIPMLIRELVVVEDLDKQTYTLRPKPTPAAPDTPPPPPPRKQAVRETSAGDRLNILLAYLPVDPKSLQRARYEAYLVNDSNYRVFFNYAVSLNNSWISRHTELVEPNTKVFMEEFASSELGDMERISVQLLAFKEKPYPAKAPVSVELRMDTTKFYKLHCFLENDYFDEDALIFPLVRDDVPGKETFVSADALKEAMMTKIKGDRPVKRPVKKEVAESNIIEVDLHITSLLDNISGLTPSDMLSYQLDRFRDILNQYADRKGQQIVFIHGKGNGVLRSSMEKELKHRYPSYNYQDASFREYGFGATLVTVR
ncbi:MAG: DUF2027 domain-containing protein [Tannerellaceae bacterium]|jgi:hypothetical protein|nr:DUF2027 domain-containing protein [Tannerellaceae bacterium]